MRQLMVTTLIIMKWRKNEDNVDDDMTAEEDSKVEQLNNESYFITVTTHGRKVKQRAFLDPSASVTSQAEVNYYGNSGMVATNNCYQILSHTTDEEFDDDFCCVGASIVSEIEHTDELRVTKYE